MTALYDLIAVATDVTDMTVAQLTAQPKLCEELVQRIQNIGKLWDQHPSWHGRNWYVQVLLAVASLSRVVEWWEAEKQFWNFTDDDDEKDEPLVFVMKPADEPSSTSIASATTSPVVPRPGTESSALAAEDENKLRLARPHSQGRKSRDDQPKVLASSSSSVNESATAAEAPRSPPKLPTTDSARVLATERLRLQAETAQSQNIVMELSLDGDHFIWVNYAWSVVVGSDMDELPGTRVSRLLHPSDWTVFRHATQRLQDDESHTVEVRFKLRVEPDPDREVPSGATLYRPMDGKGMLMIDREDGMPSHTMWVVKPVGPPRWETDAGTVLPDPPELDISAPAAPEDEPSDDEEEEPLPFARPISIAPILCRICESQIPQWYFEKHSETCVEVHRLEAEISECNESISELRRTIKEMSTAMDRSSPAVPEYRGMPIFSPSSSPTLSSPLQFFRVNKMQRMGVKKMQRRLLEQLDDILQVAGEISIPALKEEESKEPIERQRLLSPSSERKVTQIRNWNKPSTEDAALGQLVEDVERIMRQKINNVVRMQNTIKYSEKIWCEWREKVDRTLGLGEESDGSDSEDDVPLGVSRSSTMDSVPEDMDDHSSTTSEYAFNGDAASSDPTPMASCSPIPYTSQENRSSASLVHNPHKTMYTTRSSTPSSISSPLALAAPIVASSSPDDIPPPMNLDDYPSSVVTIKPQASQPNLLEPFAFVTPPTSPNVVPKDAQPAQSTLTREGSTRRGHRRQSMANPLTSPPGVATPLSPRQPSAAPLSRTTPTSIKDFDIIKPISKGAFGSVFLAKKKVTGDYYAIKVLKKADMISKNQITNVKAERMILMTQAESPFVAKLYFTFQSKDNLYLVMEYLNGGDCAALIKSLGSLPEEWTKNYIAEVTLGLEYLHARGVVHRDLKPDNLLIDQHGHLKLTDFGLSRIGLLGRQTREGQMTRLNRYPSRSRPPSLDSAYLSSPVMYAADGGSYFNPRPTSATRFGNSPHLFPTDDASESSGDSQFLLQRRSGKSMDSPMQSFASELTQDLRTHANANAASSGGGTPPGEQKFVGTPDYLAPETILGLRGDDAAVDWWALGVITYEFLYGIPPFHAETPEKVFENILSCNIEWHEDWIEFSKEARDFMERLMTLDPTQRLGANGAQEVKDHQWFESIEWDKVTSTEAAFIPQVTDPESTDYFDPRGAIPQLFNDEEHIIAGQPVLDSPRDFPGAQPIPAGNNGTAQVDDFGAFSFKNLPVLKQANDDVIRKLKTDQMAPLTHTLSEPMGSHARKHSLSQRMKKPPSVVTTVDSKTMTPNPPSPATSTSSIASSPSRMSMPPSTPGSSGGHSRKPSEFGAVERFKFNHLDGRERGNSMPSRLRTASISSGGDGSGSENWNSSSVGHGSTYHDTPSSSVLSIDLKKGPDPSDRAVTCLLAEDNPITAKIIETLLIRLGCRCVVVADGSEAISVAMGDIKFDCILMDLHMPVLDGEGAARYIKSTNGKNAHTPIISVSAYSGTDPNEGSGLFSASLSKPLQKADLLAVMRKLGFKTMPSHANAGSVHTKLTASHLIS